MKHFKYPGLLMLIFLGSCGGDDSDIGRIAGFTQGTTYSIAYTRQSRYPIENIRQEVERILLSIDNSLSVYNDSSVISRLNRNEISRPDQLLAEVFEKAMKISERTGGAFDITVMPLVRAWGFGPDERMSFDSLHIDSLLSFVGYRKVRIEQGRLVKSDPRISLDVNAIAQGYTVDLICRRFDEMEMSDYLVEIGGEVRVKGKKSSGYWKIGIDRPEEGNMTPGDDLQAVIELYNKSLATSGNYRKFFVENGIKFSHTIDPLTGYPAKNRLLSATIIADDCSTADGLATACMVKGVEWSIDLISSDPSLEGYLVFSDESGKYNTWISEGLKGMITEEQSD